MIRSSPGWFGLLIVAAVAMQAAAQLTERPGGSLDDPVETPRDLSGLSIKNPRVRIVHTTDALPPELAGGSMYLQQADPWLGYQRGRNLTQREFRQRDGVYGDAGLLDGPLLPDGATHMMSRAHANSCAVCHNNPYRDGGAGATIAKNGGAGRNTPHLFGAGLLEMLGLQLRLQALAIADDNRDGWISVAEAEGKRCRIANLPEGAQGARRVIDYGAFEDADGDGRPDLNPVFNPMYVDENGRRIAFAPGLKFPGVAGYTLECQAFGFGHLFVPFRPPVSTTLRSFIATPMDIHSGLQPFDPTTLDDPDGDGFSRVSNAGALQCVTAAGKDRGAVRGPTGISLDDPDRDGYCEEISEGDLDVMEWYLLNHPAPARGPVGKRERRGEKHLAALGCVSCHVPDWRIEAANPDASGYTQRFDGDRRFFHLHAAYNPRAQRLEGRLESLAENRDGRWLPRRGAFTVRGVYSDFKYHDLGDKFAQLQYDGSVVRLFRTSPLWGAGSTAPYGHDGASLSLHEVILRHGGEARDERERYAALSDDDRQAILAFLRSLVLYQTDQLPADLDGDGRISARFIVAGQDTGPERFNPEWLFRTPGRIEGPVHNLAGWRVNSQALTNVRAAYGLDLPLLRDSDEDGFPDAVDPAPSVCGYRDGAR